MFLIMLVLVQRGRGGGLAGALGGPGGQSAFGTKAGDLFTRITIVVATIWIFLCASAVFFLKSKKFAPTGGSETNATMEGTGDSTIPPATGGATSDAVLPGLKLDLSSPSGTDGTAELSSMPELPNVDVGEAATTETPETEPAATEPAATETPETEASEPASELKLEGTTPDSPASEL